MVAAAGTTSKESLARAVAGIEQVGGNVIGVVLVGVKEESLYGQYGYGYYNDKEHSDDQPNTNDGALLNGSSSPLNNGTGPQKRRTQAAIESLGFIRRGVD